MAVVSVTQALLQTVGGGDAERALDSFGRAVERTAQRTRRGMGAMDKYLAPARQQLTQIGQLQKGLEAAKPLTQLIPGVRQVSEIFEVVLKGMSEKAEAHIGEVQDWFRGLPDTVRDAMTGAKTALAGTPETTGAAGIPGGTAAQHLPIPLPVQITQLPVPVTQAAPTMLRHGGPSGEPLGPPGAPGIPVPRTMIPPEVRLAPDVIQKLAPPKPTALLPPPRAPAPAAAALVPGGAATPTVGQFPKGIASTLSTLGLDIPVLGTLFIFLAKALDIATSAVEFLIAHSIVLQGVLGGLSTVFTGLLDTVLAAFAPIFVPMIAAFASLVPVVQSVMETMKPLIAVVGGQMAAVFEQIVPLIKPVVEAFTTIVSGFILVGFQTLVTALTGLANLAPLIASVVDYLFGLGSSTIISGLTLLGNAADIASGKITDVSASGGELRKVDWGKGFGAILSAFLASDWTPPANALVAAFASVDWSPAVDAGITTFAAANWGPALETTISTFSTADWTPAVNAGITTFSVADWSPAVTKGISTFAAADWSPAVTTGIDTFAKSDWTPAVNAVLRVFPDADWSPAVTALTTVFTTTDWKPAIRGVVDDLEVVAAEQFVPVISNAIFAGISGGLSGAIGGGLGGALGGGPGGGIDWGAVGNTIASGLASLLPGFQHGGSALHPMAAIVGEVPEAIVPLDRLEGLADQLSSAIAAGGQTSAAPIYVTISTEVHVSMPLSEGATGYDESELRALFEQLGDLQGQQAVRSLRPRGRA